MRHSRGFLRAGVVVAGVLAYGTPAVTPATASATTATASAASPVTKPASPARIAVPLPVPRPVPAPLPDLARPFPDPEPASLPVRSLAVPPPAAVPPPLPLARPVLGRFGAPAGRPLRGRITLAVPAAETLGFRVADPALLPAGITIDADGVLGGASRVPGVWTVPVEACTRAGGCAPGAVTITVTAPCAAPPAGAAPAPPAPATRSAPGV